MKMLTQTGKTIETVQIWCEIYFVQLENFVFGAFFEFFILM